MNPRQIEEVALVIGILGALTMALGAAVMVLANRSYEGPAEMHHRREKWAYLVGSILIALSFAGTLVSVLQR